MVGGVEEQVVVVGKMEEEEEEEVEVAHATSAEVGGRLVRARGRFAQSRFRHSPSVSGGLSYIRPDLQSLDGASASSSPCRSHIMSVRRRLA